MDGAFGGWNGDFKGFFLGLKVNNSKAYFEDHRKQYEHDVKAPLVALLAGLEPEFGPARISRPNRDIRFSADKSPYKTNIYASTERGGDVGPDGEGAGGGGGGGAEEGGAPGQSVGCGRRTGPSHPTPEPAGKAQVRSPGQNQGPPGRRPGLARAARLR